MTRRYLTTIACAAAATALACASGGGGRAAAHRQTAFIITSLGSTYPLAGSLRGQIQVRSDSVVLLVEDGAVDNQMPEAQGGTAVDSVSVAAGIAAPDSAGWRLEAVGAPSPVALELGPGARARLSPRRLAVAVPAGADLTVRWAVVDFRARHRGINGLTPGPFVTYACSGVNLLGPTAASAGRSAILVLDYTRAC